MVVRCFALVLLFSVAFPVAAAAQPEVLLPANSTWRYLDQGEEEPGWTELNFDDSLWSNGKAQLGYGNGAEERTLSFGADVENRHITSWFRGHFSVEDAADIAALNLNLLVDDGAVVYLNGAEVLRRNLPDGAIAPETLASEDVVGSDEHRFFHTAIDPAGLIEGRNVLAVEVHQSAPDSRDLAFDLSLFASDGGTWVVRGPYLQMASPTGMSVRWRTDRPSDSVLWWGRSPDALEQQVSEPGERIDHELRVEGLDAETVYYYAVGTGDGPLAGGDDTHQFKTAPPVGVPRGTRIWVIGDAGTASPAAALIRDAYKLYTGDRRADVWLMLGDNAYGDGSDHQYQRAVYDMYPELLRSTTAWPTLGNHDGHTADSGTQTGPYYDMFTLPKEAELGGAPSGTEAYYSFDHGNIHFVVLDSYDSPKLEDSDMLLWLREDLTATTADWIIAFFHHPPYTRGTHNSDVEFDHILMRQNVVPVLEEFGVDLVLSGHSHTYERSVLIDGHYGFAFDFIEEEMALDTGDGDPEGDGAYNKPSLGPASNEGAVYVVAGSSGQFGSGTLDHPAMYRSLPTLASLVIDVDGNFLRGTMVNALSDVQDSFVIQQGDCPMDDVDADLDGACNSVDNCLYTKNPRQRDSDDDGLGNLCDPSPGCGCDGTTTKAPVSLLLFAPLLLQVLLRRRTGSGSQGRLSLRSQDSSASV